MIKLIGRVVFLLMVRCAELLRPWFVRMAGNTLGGIFYVLSKRYRNVALKNLRAAYKNEKSEAEIEVIAKSVFKHFCREAVQFFRLIALSKEKIDSMAAIKGAEHIDNALAAGKGCIVLTAHYGNWELLARKLNILGYKVNVIARDSDDPGMTGITTQIREQGGYRVFDRDQPIIGAFRSLRNNEILGILPDQNESDGVFVNFFSKPAATAIGPAVLSLKSGAPIVPAFAVSNGCGEYEITVYPKIEFQPGEDEDENVLKLTGLVTAAIEKEIRRNPSQWLWLHDRWKKSPEARDV